MSYGYDMISYDDNYGTFDENYYTEMSRPPIRIATFENKISDLLSDDENTQKLKMNYVETVKINNYLNSKNEYLKHVIAKKNNDLNTMNNQLYLLYVLLFISVILVISQKISYANLQQLYEILRLSSKYPDNSAPLAQPVVQPKFA